MNVVTRVSDISMKGAIRRAGTGASLARERKDLYYVILGMIYKLVLDFSFLSILPAYYGGPTYASDFSLVKWVISTIIALALLYYMPKRDGAAAMVVQLGVLYIVIPIVSVYAYRNESTVFLLLIVASFLIVEIIARYLLDFGPPGRRIEPLGNRSTQRSVNLFFAISLGVVVIAFMIAMFILQGVPTLQALDLRSVYDLRSQQNLPLLMDKLTPPIAKVILPFFLIVGIHKKWRWLSILALAASFLIYLWSGHKYYLFAMVIVYIIVKLYRSDRNLLVFTLFVSVTVLCVALRTLSIFSDSDLLMWPYDLIVRRSLYLPATIKFFYFDYFIGLDRPWNFSGSQIFHLAFGPRVPMDYQQEIGGLYMGSYTTNANAGMYGDEMASFGIGGVVAASVFFGIFALIVGLSSIKNGDRFALAMALPLLLDFSNGSIVKGMTREYGLLAIMLILLYSVERHAHGADTRENDIRRNPHERGTHGSR